jgi:3-oxoacyl-[acyl-carrier protein] reductase
MPESKPMAGRVAVVTGGGSGIGAAAAQMLGARGAVVALVSDRPTTETDVVRDAIAGQGGTAESHQCDVRDRAAVDAMIADIAKRHGRIDMLVNSAGVFLMAPVEETSVAQAELVMGVNYFGTYNMIQAVMPLMKAAGRGSIVNVASMAADFPSPQSTVYASSKGAVLSLTRALVPELARTGVRVNAVMPAGVRTPMVAAFHSPTTDEGRAVLAMLESTTISPHGRLFLEPEDVAEVILFLASDAAKGVHGVGIPVADGMGTAMG